MDYTYECRNDKCKMDEEFEINHPMSEVGQDQFCPTCSGLATRIIGAPSFHGSQKGHWND